ncbi:MAG: hypothetical protein ABI622_05965 [Chloroflexota bacterium]
MAGTGAPQELGRAHIAGPDHLTDAPAGAPAIARLPELVAQLPDAARARFDRLFELRVDTARTNPPPEMDRWLTEYFGSVDAVREQTVVRLTDRVMLEGTVFAPLRALRPVDGDGRTPDDARVAGEIDTTRDDPFCDPLHGTPAAAWGRVRGHAAVSGANAAAYDAEHGILVFDDHDPLAFDVEDVADLLALGRRWADAARATDPAADRYLFLWNCLWRAGGSIIHGHAQTLLGHGRHHARLERWRRDAAAYAAASGHHYLDDLLAAHRDLGLAVPLPGATLISSLTPVKERELWLVADSAVDDASTAFRTSVGRVVTAYRDVLGVRAFNLALWRAPLDATWPELRPLVRIVDRGAPFVRPSDIGAMELFATPVVGSDPFEVIADLREALAGPPSGA